MESTFSNLVRPIFTYVLIFSLMISSNMVNSSRPTHSHVPKRFKLFQTSPLGGVPPPFGGSPRLQFPWPFRPFVFPFPFQPPPPPFPSSLSPPMLFPPGVPFSFPPPPPSVRISPPNPFMFTPPPSSPSPPINPPNPFSQPFTGVNYPPPDLNPPSPLAP